MPKGKDYILFYLKLLLESIDHNGELRFSDAIPYNEQMLSVVTNTNVDIVRSAMKIFLQLNMVDIFDDQTIYMSEVEKLIGSETEWAKKKRLQRSKEDNVPKLSSKCPTEIEIEKEIEKEIELEGENETPTPQSNPDSIILGKYNNVVLTSCERDKLMQTFPNHWEDRIEKFSEYLYESGKRYANHFNKIMRWAKEDGVPTNADSANKSYDIDDFFAAAVAR
jgi:predicted phage replisome organizer